MSDRDAVDRPKLAKNKDVINIDTEPSNLGFRRLKMEDPIIMAHMKQAKTMPKGRGSACESGKDRAERALCKAADQKKTNRYMALSKKVVVIAKATMRRSLRREESDDFAKLPGFHDDSKLP